MTLRASGAAFAVLLFSFTGTATAQVLRARIPVIRMGPAIGLPASAPMPLLNSGLSVNSPSLSLSLSVPTLAPPVASLPLSVQPARAAIPVVVAVAITPKANHAAVKSVAVVLPILNAVKAAKPPPPQAAPRMDSSPSALFDGIRLRSPSAGDPVIPGSDPRSASRSSPRLSRAPLPVSPLHLEPSPGRDHSHPAPSAPAHESALKRAMAVALLFIAVEMIGGALTGSAALRADALHLLSDQVIVAAALLSSWLSRRPGASPKIEAVVGLLAAGLIGFTGIHMGVEAWERFVAPGAAATWSVALFALASLGANVSSALILRRHRGGSLGAKGAFLVAMTDTVGSIGVIVSAAAAILLGWAWAEPVAVALIGMMVVKIAWGLGKPAWKAFRAPR